MTERPRIDDAVVRASDGVMGAPLGADTLARWAADAAVDESARARSRQRWLEIQADEEGTLAGTALDLAEQARAVVIDVAGQQLRGAIRAVGFDFVLVDADHRASSLVRLDAIDVLRAEPGSSMTRGDRATTVSTDLIGLLGPIAGERPDVVVRTRAGVIVRGRLQSSGRDVLRLRGDGDPPSPLWVPVDAISVLTIVG